MISPNPTPDEVMRAFIEYLKRQNRISHPAGEWVDGSWHILPTEVCSCCAGVQESQLFNNHCRSLEHVSILMGANPKEVQKLIDIYNGKEERDVQRRVAKSSARLGGYKVRSGSDGSRVP